MARYMIERPPETENPARAATGAGQIEGKTSREAHVHIYQHRLSRAIKSYTVGPDLLIQTFALAEALT